MQALQEIEMHYKYHIHKGIDSAALYQMAPRYFVGCRLRVTS